MPLPEKSTAEVSLDQFKKLERLTLTLSSQFEQQRKTLAAATRKIDQLQEQVTALRQEARTLAARSR
jgi:phage shock protein A